MFNVFLDKEEVFECAIELQGASISKAIPRILLECNGINLVFIGKIAAGGKCKIPIKKLRGLVDEGSRGTIKLEIISEDVYFQPWSDKFEVSVARKATVEVKQQQQQKSVDKPAAVVSEVKTTQSAVDKTVAMLIEHGVSLGKFQKNKTKLVPAIKRQMKLLGHTGKEIEFVKEVVSKLSA